jgi:hypothetical protein
VLSRLILLLARVILLLARLILLSGQASLDHLLQLVARFDTGHGRRMLLPIRVCLKDLWVALVLQRIGALLLSPGHLRRVLLRIRIRLKHLRITLVPQRT